MPFKYKLFKNKFAFNLCFCFPGIDKIDSTIVFSKIRYYLSPMKKDNLGTVIIVFALVVFIAGVIIYFKDHNSPANIARQYTEDSLTKIARIKDEILQETKPVVVEAMSTIMELKQDIHTAETGGMVTKKQVVDQYNMKLAPTMGYIYTFNKVKARVLKDGDKYVKFVQLKEAAAISLRRANESSFDAERLRNSK